MTRLHVLRVFLGPDGRGGNPLGVFLDGPAIPPARRLAVAHELGFSETVFVDEVADDSARMFIFTPGSELEFAGHPTVGTSWLLRASGSPVGRLLVPAGEVGTWSDGQLTWIRARAEWAPRMEVVRLADAAAVDGLTGPPAGHGSWYAWAWLNEAAGEVRSRYFAPDYGIAEDEATGAAAVLLGARSGRPLTIRQGVGSVLLARPGADGTVEVGGRVTLVETRAFPD